MDEWMDGEEELMSGRSGLSLPGREQSRGARRGVKGDLMGCAYSVEMGTVHPTLSSRHLLHLNS